MEKNADIMSNVWTHDVLHAPHTPIVVAGMSFWTFAFIFAVLVLLLLFRRGNLFLNTSRAPYQRGRFLTANEKCFLRALDGALGEGYRVFAQVRLADLVEVREKFSDARRWAALKKVFGKSVDFVIVDGFTFEPVAVIEVDDRTHLLSTRQERDVFVNSVFEEIGLPMLRVTAKREYSVLGLRKMLAEVGLDVGLADVAFAQRARS